MQGPVSGRRISRRMMRTIIIMVCVLAVIIAVVVGATMFMDKRAQEQQKEEQARVEKIVTDTASAVAEPVAELLAQVRQVAESPELIESFSLADATALQDRANTLADKIPSALKVRLFIPGNYSIDRESRPPLGYASLDLLREAEEGTAPLPVELHNFGSDDAHLVVVKRVKNGSGELVGLLHAGIAPGNYIKVAGQDGYTELVQLAGGAPLVLSRAGDVKYKSGMPVTRQIAGTRWQIRYWPESSLLLSPEEGEGGIPFLVPLLIVLLLAGVLVFVRMRRSVAGGGSETDDSSNVVFGGAIKAIQEGLHPGLEKLMPNIPGLGQKKPVEPVSQGMKGDDVTNVAKASDVTKKIAEAAGKEPPPDTVEVQEETPVARKKAPREDTGDEQTQEEEEPVEIPEVIFRAYDIRGVVEENLDAAIVRQIGMAIGAEAIRKGQKGIVVGRDGRNSSEELAAALIEGLRATGADVIDIGMVPTPLLYFATHHLETDSGVMVTGSHNGPEYNGLKIVLDGETLSGDGIQAIRKRIEEGDMPSGQGGLQTADITADYLRRATEDIPVALGGAFKLVVDCGNGVAGMIAPQLYRALGHDVEELYCDVDGNFPNHHPDPGQPENLRDLIEKVKETGADIGLAFDGDGDRLGVVDGDGNIIWPDRQMMLFARDVLSRNAGKPIIFDVKCSRYLKAIIEMNGGKPVMWKTGHSLIKHKMQEIDAPLAGEMSGHIFFKERWYGFDDGLYAGARLLEILTAAKKKPVEVFAELPGGVTTPELKIPLPEKYHGKFMQALKKKASFEDAEINDIDGIRVDFSDRWGLIRPSNTTPCLVVRFEAENDAALDRIKTEFRELIQSVTKDLKLPF